MNMTDGSEHEACPPSCFQTAEELQLFLILLRKNRYPAEGNLENLSESFFSEHASSASDFARQDREGSRGAATIRGFRKEAAAATTIGSSICYWSQCRICYIWSWYGSWSFIVTSVWQYYIVLGHLALALVYWPRFRQTDPTNKSSAQSFYMLVWELLSVENLLTHFVC
ncbi:hypothetical protein NE237_031608 [Protea cynaroides]|uniref:Uncharacterized protein n=1 Tax=Protea cynaroides TaxID=273540 RepID=A0A9Q0L1W0_9MAGN|nr:hypothetical protein NE237_031608 [Protea cynaroides]